MIELHYWPTPNGHKITLFLEEADLSYRIVPVDIGRGEQFRPDFLKIAPNNRMPAIVDHEPADGGEPVSLFESGAILLYLAEKTGRLLPTHLAGKAEVTQWLMFQMSGVGPMFGQLAHFTRFAKEKIPYAIERYRNESLRILGVMDKQLGAREYLAGEYSVADIATYPWLTGFATDYAPDLFENVPNVKAWLERVGARPAVQRGMKVPDLKR